MTFDKIRETCLSFPGATEGVKWENHICFMVAEKMFCITTIDDGAQDVSIKVSDEDFDKMTEREGIIPAPYMARNKWVRVERYKALKPKEWQHYLEQSYELIKSKLPKKVRESLG